MSVPLEIALMLLFIFSLMLVYGGALAKSLFTMYAGVIGTTFALVYTMLVVL